MSNCCNEKRNFGHPTCIGDEGVVTRGILVPLKKADGTANIYDLSVLNYNTIWNSFYSSEDTRWFPLPEFNNFEYAVADTQTEEASSGKISFLREGKKSFTAELWDKDATFVAKGKLAKLRCSDWGIVFVTDANVIIGREFELGGVSYFAPIPLDSQSIDPKAMFKTDSVTKKIMLSMDLDRNVDDSTFYSIGGDEIWDAVAEEVKSIDFNDLPQIIDCSLSPSNVSTTNIDVAINDDYRQGQQFAGYNAKGNVLGLVLADFSVLNLTTGLPVVPSAVNESEDGYYEITIPAQTSADRVKVSLALDSTKVINYSGSATVLIP